MKGRLKIFVIAIFKSILLALFLVSVADSAGLNLAVPEKLQEHSQWCWAGSSQSVLEYYDSVEAQCTIANFACGRSDCCGPYAYNVNNTCNQPKSFITIQNILTHWGLQSTVQSGALSWDTCVSEINAGRLFIIGIDYNTGGRALCCRTRV